MMASETSGISVKFLEVNNECLLSLACSNSFTIDFFQMVWMLPSDNEFNIAWDTTMCVNTSTGVEVRRLMAKAFKGPLPPQQQQQIKKELDKDSKLVYNIGLCPAKVI